MTRAKTEEYRRRAQPCLDLALAISLKTDRAVLIDMVQNWLRRAEEEDAKEEIIQPPVAEQPQQQQRTQPKYEDKKE